MIELKSEDGCPEDKFIKAGKEFVTKTLRPFLESLFDTGAKSVAVMIEKFVPPEVASIAGPLAKDNLGQIKELLMHFAEIFDLQSEQIYKAAYDCLKLGKAGRLTTKTIDALTCMFVSGGVVLQDRVKIIFDAFDHDGDGEVTPQEKAGLIKSGMSLLTAFMHAGATAYLTFQAKHMVPAVSAMLFHHIAEDKKEMKLENIALCVCMALELNHKDREDFEKATESVFKIENVDDAKTKLKERVEEEIKGASDPTKLVQNLLEEVLRTFN